MLAERMLANALPFRHDAEQQRRAGVPVPDLDRVDAMPCRAFARRQQVIDGGAGAAGAVRRRVAEGLTVPAALRMADEAETADNLLRRLAAEIVTHARGTVAC